MFFKLLKVAENLRVELTNQSDRCVPHESRNAWKPVPRLSDKRGMTYEYLKISFSKNCYSAPICPIAVRLVSVLFGMVLYKTVKFQKHITLYVCTSGRRRNYTNQQFSLAHKSFNFSPKSNVLLIFCSYWSKVHV